MSPEDLKLRRIFTNLEPKGISVFFAMILLGGTNITQKRLQNVTGYTDKPVKTACEIIHAEGLATPIRLGKEIAWTLTDYSVQLTLSGDFLRRISDHRLISNNDPLLNESLKEKETLILIAPPSENLRSKLEDVDETLAEALDDARIGEPTKSELLQKPGLTGLHVRRWEKIKKDEVGEGYKPGLLVWALRSLPDHPELPEDPDAEPLCPACKIHTMNKMYHFCRGCNDYYTCCKCHEEEI